MVVRIYTVKPGDRLSDVAAKYTDNPLHVQRVAKAIFEHNRDLIPNPNQLEIGQKLVIPHPTGGM